MAVLIGLGVGQLGYYLSFEKSWEKCWVYLLAGLAGTFGCNLLFRFLVSHQLMFYTFYSRKAIVIEEVMGAILVVYLIKLWRARP